MNPITSVMVLSSLLVLLTGAWAWRITGNYALLINTTLCSYGLLFAAQQLTAHSAWAVLVPLMCTMLLGGRFVGTWWRSRREAELRPSLRLIGATAALALAATLTAFSAR